MKHIKTFESFDDEWKDIESSIEKIEDLILSKNDSNIKLAELLMESQEIDLIDLFDGELEKFRKSSADLKVFKSSKTFLSDFFIFSDVLHHNTKCYFNMNNGQISFNGVSIKMIPIKFLHRFSSKNDAMIRVSMRSCFVSLQGEIDCSGFEFNFEKCFGVSGEIKANEVYLVNSEGSILNLFTSLNKLVIEDPKNVIDWSKVSIKSLKECHIFEHPFSNFKKFPKIENQLILTDCRIESFEGLVCSSNAEFHLYDCIIEDEELFDFPENAKQIILKDIVLGVDHLRRSDLIEIFGEEVREKIIFYGLN